MLRGQLYLGKISISSEMEEWLVPWCMQYHESLKANVVCYEINLPAHEKQSQPNCCNKD